jgi:hypothetical protein
LADAQFDASDPDSLMLAGQGRQLVNQILAERQLVHGQSRQPLAEFESV